MLIDLALLDLFSRHEYRTTILDHMAASGASHVNSAHSAWRRVHPEGLQASRNICAIHDFSSAQLLCRPGRVAVLLVNLS